MYISINIMRSTIIIIVISINVYNHLFIIRKIRKSITVYLTKTQVNSIIFTVPHSS